MRELTNDEKLSLFTFMLTKCETLMDYVCEFGNFDDATGECSLAQVICDHGKFFTVGIFWDGGNHYMNVFQAEVLEGGKIQWRLVCDQDCN